MSDVLSAIEIETHPEPRFAVIWMHGLGADGNDFVPIVPELGLPDATTVRFVFPHAPMIPVTCNGGYIMRAWYDIVSLSDAARHVDEAGLRASRDSVRALIAAQNARGIPSSRIVLAGFSQGGAMAYLAGLTHPETLCGIVALSTYIPSPALLEAELAPANATTPIFSAHGVQDDVVPLALGVQARELLAARQYPLTWQTYPMPHSVCLEEIQDIGVWLQQRFAAAA